MFYLLFFIYLGIASYFIPRIPFIKRSGLSSKLILALFLIKITAGVLNAFIFLHFYGTVSDGYTINYFGIQEYHVLVTKPAVFFGDIIKSNYGEHYGGFFSSYNSYWNDLRINIIIKILAIFNIISRGNFYVNTFLLNFFCFFSHIALYRIFIHIYPNKKWLILAGCFLLPSTMFFTSGIGKDCIVFLMIGLLCYALYFSLNHSFSKKRIIVIIVATIFLLFIRNYVLAGILPAVLAWIICIKSKKNPIQIFITVYAGLVLSLIIIQLVKHDNPILKIITEKQQDFFALPIAGSQIKTDTLYPTLTSFVFNAPQAFNHAIFRPYIWENNMPLSIITSVEVLIYILLFVLLLFFNLKQKIKDPFILFSNTIAFSLLLFIGYIVPNTGSIIRYRSIYLPFLLIPILCSIDFEKIKKLLRIKL